MITWMQTRRLSIKDSLSVSDPYILSPGPWMFNSNFTL